MTTQFLEHLRQWIEQPPEECWVWTGPVSGYAPDCYGAVRLQPASIERAPRKVHRVTYELYREPIPPKMQIDHLCRNRMCANPQHLEVVTCRENLRRGFGFVGEQLRRTHCPQGHPLVEGNLVRYKTHKQCRTCTNARNARAYHRKRVTNPEWYQKELVRKREWRLRDKSNG